MIDFGDTNSTDYMNKYWCILIVLQNLTVFENQGLNLPFETHNCPKHTSKLK